MKQKAQFSELNINGAWSVNCENELTEFDVKGNEAYLSLYSDNAIYINVRVEKNPHIHSEFLIYFKSTSSQKKYYEDKESISDNEISKTRIIGRINIKNKNTLILSWIGLYNQKTKSLKFTDDFVMIKENGGINPIPLSRCE